MNKDLGVESMGHKSQDYEQWRTILESRAAMPEEEEEDSIYTCM
jgi:hypothetical protein